MNTNDNELHGIDLTLQEWALAFAAGDSDRLVSLVTADAEFWSQEAPPILGRTALREAFDGGAG
jgi:ketosteroid isomerase-like protein